MNPLEQAYEAGYSDEEIIQEISNREPEWVQAYQSAKDAGYSDSEILVERQRRKLEEPQQSIDEEEQQPKDQFAEQENEEISNKPYKVDFLGGPKHNLSSLTLGLSENIPGFKVTDEEKENLSSSDKLFSALIGFLPVEGAVRVIANPITKKIGQWAVKSPVGQKAITSMGKLLGIGVTGAAIEGAEEAFRGELPSIEDMAEQGAIWAALDVSLTALGKTGSFVKSLIKKAEITKKTSGKVLRDTINEMIEKGVDFNDAEKSTAIAMDILEGIEKPVAKVPAKDLKNRKITQEKTKEIIEDTSKLRESVPEKINVNEILESKNKGVSEAAQKEYETALDKYITEAEKYNVELNKYNSSKNKGVSKAAQKEYETALNKYTTEAEKYNVELNKYNSSKNKGVSEVALDSISKRAKTEIELGNSIKNGIDTEIARHKKIYKPLYNFAQEVAEGIEVVASNEISVAQSILKEVKDLKTKPSGYQTVVNSLEAALDDLGVVSVPKSKGKSSFSITEKIPVSKKMELKRRLNQIIDYDVLDWEIKQKLKPLVDALRTGIKTDLKVGSAEASSIWQNAEAEYAKAAKKFKIPNIRKIRYEVRPERIASDIKSPTVVRELKNALPENVYKQTEREILEQISSSEIKSAKNQVREMSTTLSEDSNKIANEIIEAKRIKHNKPVKPKKPIEPKTWTKPVKPVKPIKPVSTKKVEDLKNKRKNKIENSILEDLATAQEKGIPPKETLELWKTKKGQKIVENSFKDSPNKSDVIEYLNKQSLNDIIETIINKDGVIDFTKVNRFVRNKGERQFLELVGGKDAVTFFNQLEQISKQFEKNLLKSNIIHKTETLKSKGSGKRGKYLISKKSEKNQTFLDISEKKLKELGINNPFKLKYLLYTLGAGLYAPKLAATAFGTTVLIKLLNKPNVRKAFKEVSTKEGISNSKMGALINLILESSKEEDDEY